jgi:hypothetical protein
MDDRATNARRQWLRAGLAWAATAAAGPAWAAGAAGAASRNDAAPLRLATAWRLAAPAAGEAPDRVGVIAIDWAARRIAVVTQVPVPGRAHGLLALADGGFVAVANRPGRWLLRCDASGEVVARVAIDDERPRRTFNGHAEADAQGEWLYTTETDPATGEGWISVRDAHTLARVAQFAAGGRDPHQLLAARDGSLVVAIGGIVRDLEGRPIERERMAPALVQLAAGDGRPLGRWQLDDPRLSLRHIAWAQGAAAGSSGAAAPGAPMLPLLGVALQAEHDREEERRAAPTLAVWDGHTLVVPTRDASGAGYAGDIAAGPGGGFVLSAQKARRGLWWHPGAPDALTLVAELTEPCALATVDGGAGVLLSAGRGAARWHAREAPGMLPWPVALAPDNHWVVLRNG